MVSAGQCTGAAAVAHVKSHSNASAELQACLVFMHKMSQVQQLNLRRSVDSLPHLCCVASASPMSQLLQPGNKLLTPSDLCCFLPYLGPH